MRAASRFPAYAARAFCHELDHLDGKLFTDKMIRRIDPDEIG